MVRKIQVMLQVVKPCIDEYGGCKVLQNVCILPYHYMASQFEYSHCCVCMWSFYERFW